MNLRRGVALAACLTAAVPSIAPAGERVVTLAAALQLARERAPELRAARARTAEAEAQRLTAAEPGLENPELEIEAGPRDAGSGRGTDHAVGLLQGLEPAGRRRARIDAAGAGLARSAADERDLTRHVLREAGAAFLRALHAEGALDLARLDEAAAAEVLRAAEARLAAGDAPRLDVSLAAMAGGRARASREAAEADRAAALGELRRRLGLEPDEGLRLAGALEQEGAPPAADLAALAAAAPARGDLARIAAELEAARAESRLARAESRPRLAFGVRHEREEGDGIALGVLRVGLPLFRRGEGQRAAADARAARLGIELDGARRAATVETGTAADVLARRRAAARSLSGEAAALIETNDALARLAYEEGQIGLGELLLVRREILDTRRARIDRLLEAALAELDWRAAAGILE